MIAILGRSQAGGGFDQDAGPKISPMVTRQPKILVN
jgi:hypothetical protein